MTNKPKTLGKLATRTEDFNQDYMNNFGNKKKNKGRKPEGLTVFLEEGYGWCFYDENGDYYGPFKSKEKAMFALKDSKGRNYDLESY